MASTYLDNMELNAARAQLRGTDETVPLAVSGFRPVVRAAGNVGWTWQQGAGSPPSGRSDSVLLSVSQPVFEGFRLINGLKQAKAGVRAARYQLRVTEQTVLLEAVQAFMDVVQDQVILNVNAQNVTYLRTQLEGANERFKSGEGTRTDIAQAKARLSAGLTDYSTAKSAVAEALAAYLRVVGHKPKNLGGVGPIEHLLAKSLDIAIEQGLHDNPSILAATENVDVSAYQVKILEGTLLPTVSIGGSVGHSDGVIPGGSNTAAVVASIGIPIYEGGRDSTEIRQAKEILGQIRIELDLTKANVRQEVADAWAALEAARSQVESTQAEVAANELALEGVTEEQKAGQRTLLDLLNAQQELLRAKEEVVRAQRDRIVQVCTLLAAVGDLNAEFLRLKVPIYDPTAHYKQVKDDWRGMRTPDGR
jgi:outer membrane protein